jgi:hypothetical protein
LDVPDIPAVMVAVTVDFALTVLIENVAEVLPAGIEIEAGTEAEPGRLLVRMILIPPVGAPDEMLTVPALVLPPLTVVGLKVTPTNDGATTVKVAVSETDPSSAVTVA